MRLVGILSVISTIWHIVVTFTLVALLSAVAPTHQSANYVFTSLNVPDAGIDNHAYIFFLGLLMSQFCITGTFAAPGSPPICCWLLRFTYICHKQSPAQA